MPMSPQDSQGRTDRMFIEDANPQHPRRRHEFFLRRRPYRGELPTVAGFLLYPDTPAKMETTSREAFCFRPITQQDRGKGDHIAQNTQQEPHCPQPTSSRQTGRGNSGCREREPEEDGQEGRHDQTTLTAVKNKQDTSKMLSQYQKDFPPPSSCRRRRTPALPQPDNIGINPAFRIEFNTVQRETYPGWPVLNPGRLRASVSRRPNTTSES